ncbi:MAG: hypothetical protein ABI040_05630 [Rhodoferax sp.]
MSTKVTILPRWSTSSFGVTADTSPMELSALEHHLDLCRGERGRLFVVHCAVEVMHRALAPRFVTTLVVAALVIGLGSLVL